MVPQALVGGGHSPLLRGVGIRVHLFEISLQTVEVNTVLWILFAEMTLSTVAITCLSRRVLEYLKPTSHQRFSKSQLLAEDESSKRVIAYQNCNFAGRRWDEGLQVKATASGITLRCLEPSFWVYILLRSL